MANKIINYKKRGRVNMAKAIKTGINIAKFGYGLYKKYKARKSVNKGTTLAMPDWKGRTFTKMKVMSPKNAKSIEKKCLNHKKNKIILYKNALVNKTPRVYMYAGVYKAIERGAYDNYNYADNFIGGKSIPANTVYGGNIGFGRATASPLNTDNQIAYAFEIQYGNCLMWDCDMPTGALLTPIWQPDFEPNSTTTYYRAFGMYSQPIYSKREYVTIGDNRERTTANSVPALSNVLNDTDVLGIATLNYEYTITFRNLSKNDFMGYVVLFKLNKFISGDSVTMRGMSNFINYFRKVTQFQSDDDLLEANWPLSMMKIIKVKKVKLSGTYNVVNTDHGTALRTVKIMSPKSYLTVARRPPTTKQDSLLSPGWEWWDDEYHKHTYCMAFAVPMGHQVGPGSSGDPYTGIPAGEVQCVIEKRTAWCVLK